jgi:hypothetical protein
VPRVCSVCTHPALEAFDALLAGGASIRAAAARTGIGYEVAKRHRRLGHEAPPAVDPMGIVDVFGRAFEHPPVPWQRGYLTETRHTVLVKGRQIGATQAASALAIHTALTQPGSTSVIVSPSLRQSSEITVRARVGLWNLGERLRQDSASLLRTANGSRIVSLPGSQRGVRGYSCALVVVDEAAWVEAATMAAVRPLVAATGGRLIVQSTPGSPAGAFHELVMDPPADWAALRVRSDEAGTIDPAFLEAERRTMSPDLYGQEYEATFGKGVVGLLSSDDVDALFAAAS